MAAILKTQNCPANYPPSQTAQPRPNPRWIAQGARTHPCQNMPTPRPPHRTIRPATSQVPQVNTACCKHINTDSGSKSCSCCGHSYSCWPHVPQYKYAVRSAAFCSISMHGHRLPCNIEGQEADCSHVSVCPPLKSKSKPWVTGVSTSSTHTPYS